MRVAARTAAAPPSASSSSPSASSPRHRHAQQHRRRTHAACRRPRARRLPRVRASSAGGAAEGEDGPSSIERKARSPPAPVAAATPVGEFLRYTLEMEPHLFEASLDQQLAYLSQRYAEAGPDGGSDGGPASAGKKGGTKEEKDKLVLYERIGDIRLRQRQATVEDLMYAAVLQKFVAAGVDLLPPLDGRSEIGSVDLRKLTVEVHSKEALEMVKNHLFQLLGEGANQFSTAMVKISKLQAAQVYAASVMFGYFLRKVDKRFKLERQMGTLPKTQEQTIAALENLFSIDTDAAGPDGGGDAAIDIGSPPPPEEEEGDNALRRYVESFDESTLNSTARMVSREGMALAERQTGALFGDISDLASQMQKALEEGVDGDRSPITSAEMLAERMSDVVSADRVATITVDYATQKRVVLEAVAFGTFLRDVEEKVGGHELLTELPLSSGGGGGTLRFGLPGDDDDDDDDDEGGGGDGGGGSKVPTGGGRR